MKFFKYKRIEVDSTNPLEKATSELAQIIRNLDKQGKIPTNIDDQLADV